MQGLCPAIIEPVRRRRVFFRLNGETKLVIWLLLFRSNESLQHTSLCGLRLAVTGVRPLLDLGGGGDILLVAELLNAGVGHV